MQKEIEVIAKKAIAQKIFPGCVVGIIKDRKRIVLPFGHLTYESVAQPVTAETIYDIASVTKAIPHLLPGFETD